METTEKHIRIQSDAGVIRARTMARRVAQEAGFGAVDQVLIATAVSELARNIVEYARPGEVVISVAEGSGRRGVTVVARDSGPGIPDLAEAMKEGYSTGGGLGLGLSGARRLMDEFEIRSQAGIGTTITMTKWVP